jgi:hypothetical protein
MGKKYRLTFGHVIAISAAGVIATIFGTALFYSPPVSFTPNSCHAVTAGELPDPNCTPGAINLNVTQDNLQSTICLSGYTSAIRPSVSYTNDLKIQQIQEYGYSNTDPKNYEEDHLVPLELGGNPTSPLNLWPEPRDLILNAGQKDHVENAAHAMVCSNKLSLISAQEQIALNWINFGHELGVL